MTELIHNMLFLELGFDEWVVKIDFLNKTLEWREGVVIPGEQKADIEKELSETYPQCRWLKPYKDESMGKESPIVWATCPSNAAEIFHQMNVPSPKVLEIVDGKYL